MIIMRLLLICLKLLVLLQWIEAQDNVRTLDFPAPENQSIIFSKRETKANESEQLETKSENETINQQLPPIRCLGCDGYCNSYEEGKDESGKGNRLCPLELGVLHGCVSIFKYGLKRKCITEMSMEEKLYCRNNTNLCIKCSEPDCNYVNLTINGLQATGSAPFRTPLLWLLGTCLIAGLICY